MAAWTREWAMWIWLCLVGQREAEQSKASWRLGHGVLLNGHSGLPRCWGWRNRVMEGLATAFPPLLPSAPLSTPLCSEGSRGAAVKGTGHSLGGARWPSLAGHPGPGEGPPATPVSSLRHGQRSGAARPLLTWSSGGTLEPDAEMEGAVISP